MYYNNGKLCYTMNELKKGGEYKYIKLNKRGFKGIFKGFENDSIMITISTNETIKIDKFDILHIKRV